MGSKFEHIQIKSKDKQEIYPYLVPSDTICHVAEDWLAILPENLNYTVTPKRAKKLSRLLPEQIVIYTAYFDDDIFELTVFLSGTIKCAYRSNEQGKFVIKPAQWKLLFNLDTPAVHALRCLPKTGQIVMEDLTIIQAVLKTQLWLPDISDIVQFNELEKENEVALQEFNTAQEMLKKVYNQTKATLIKVQSGFLDKVDIKENQMVWRLITADARGLYDIYQIHCYRLLETGEAEEFYNYRYPKEYYDTDCRRIHMMWKDDKHIEVMLNETEMLVIEDYQVNGDEFEKSLYREHISLLTTKYTPSIEGYYKEHLPGGAAVVKKDKNGEICASFIFSEYINDFSLYINGVVDTGSYVVCFGEMSGNEEYHMIIFVLNYDLELLRQSLVRTKSKNQEFLADKTGRVIYMQDYGNKYISKYYIEKDLFESNCLGCGGYFCNISPWGHIVLRESSATLLFIGEDLKIASRHRFKGMICQTWISKTGDFYVLTTDKYQYDLNEPNPPLKTYVYQITSNGE